MSTHGEKVRLKIRPTEEEKATLELQKLYKKLLSKGRVERIEAKGQPKGLSPKAVRNIHQVISSAMDFARSQKLIAVNPTDSCALPKLEHQKMKTLPVDQRLPSCEKQKIAACSRCTTSNWLRACGEENSSG